MEAKTWSTIIHPAVQRFLDLPYAARFAIAGAAGVLAMLVLCWIGFGFGSLGLDPTATVAFVLGITLTIGLGVGLMTLVFYSDRSGQDGAVRDTTVERQDPAPQPEIRVRPAPPSEASDVRALDDNRPSGVAAAPAAADERSPT